MVKFTRSLYWRRYNRKYKYGRVYFLEVSEGIVKIGFSNNVSRRVKELSKVSEKVNLIGTVRASRKYEKRLHRMLRQYRLKGNGELFWFDGLVKLYAGLFLEKPQSPVCYHYGRIRQDPKYYYLESRGATLPRIWSR